MQYFVCFSLGASQDPSPKDVVSSLAGLFAENLKACRAEKRAPGCKTTPKGVTPPSAEKCFVCQRPKHSCSWEYVCDDNGHRRACGSTCSACVQAAAKLKCSRGEPALKKFSLVGLVRAVSKAVQDKKGSKDVCRCFKCIPGKRSKGN